MSVLPTAATRWPRFLCLACMAAMSMALSRHAYHSNSVRRSNVLYHMHRIGSTLQLTDSLLFYNCACAA
uniref:Secreted protein n=1 Tax=Arundo donax TaxID=35708 RepID=A0A0A9FPH5_ARUDO